MRPPLIVRPCAELTPSTDRPSSTNVGARSLDTYRRYRFSGLKIRDTGRHHGYTSWLPGTTSTGASIASVISAAASYSCGRARWVRSPLIATSVGLRRSGALGEGSADCHQRRPGSIAFSNQRIHDAGMGNLAEV